MVVRTEGADLGAGRHVCNETLEWGTVTHRSVLCAMSVGSVLFTFLKFFQKK